MLALGDDNAIRGYQQIIETYRDNKQWQLATDAAAEAAKKFPNDRGSANGRGFAAGRHGSLRCRHCST